MAGKDEHGDDVICQAYMVKRSQNKKRFTKVNYKQRWFILTSSALAYYDSGGERRKERGRIETERIHTVQQAQLDEEYKSIDVGDARLFPFQVGYTDQSNDYTLYLVAKSNADRARWINAIRTVCALNVSRLSYHPAAWSARRWACCGASGRLAAGCQPADAWRRPATPAAPAAPASPASTPDASPHRDNANLYSISPAVTTVVGMPGGGGGGGGAPGTPSAKQKDKQGTPRAKIVVALYPFKAIEGGDLSLEKGLEYEVIDASQEHWWKVKDEKGLIGYIPSNYVKEKESLGLQKYEWYVCDMSRQRAESLLKAEDKEGCFVVRNSSTKGMYTLSLYTKVSHPHSKHYHIKQNSRGEFYLSDKHCCATIPELINYHRHNSGGLCSRLKATPCDRPAPPTAGLSHDKWEIDPTELVLHEELGSGQFGVVRRGRWRGHQDTAVKMMKEGTMSEDDFIEEAKVMTKLQHPNLVQLYGVCSKHRPIFIVTEYMRHGSLLNFLRRLEQPAPALLLDMCLQVCNGMSYLERHNYIHRDLAARNCLVGADDVVKVADFGLARYVLDDQYTSSGGSKFPIKWAPPEVLNYTRFSSKSDVWAYGVLMWEVFTMGKMPYGRLKNCEVVERVQRGQVLERPKACPKDIYEVMRLCWQHLPEDRPSFRALKEKLTILTQNLQAD